MDIVAYTHALRTAGQTTGVGRHMIAITQGLAATPETRVRLLLPEPEVRAIETQRLDWPLASLERITFATSRGLIERRWWLTRSPKVERWAPGCDWVYCGAEIAVPARKARVAMTIHDLEAFETDLPWHHQQTFGRAFWWNLKLRPARSRVDALITVSEFSKERIVRFLRVPPEKVHVIGNGVDERFFQADATPASAGASNVGASDAGPSDPPYLLVVGGLQQRKGAEATLAIARELQRRGSPVQIWVGGKNHEPYATEAKSMANVRLLGYLDDDKVPSLLRRSVGLLFVSRYEGFGIPALEAMATGTPAIVSQYGALPEVAGDAAMIAPDAAAGADAAERLLHDAAWREQCIARGRVRARQFRWSNCVQRLLNVFHDRPIGTPASARA